MAKAGFTLDTLPRIIGDDSDWSICIGAGCSVPIFPLWDQLAKELSSKIIGESNISSDFVKEVSPDVLIQTTFDFSNDKGNFASVLADTLYNNLFAGLSSDDKSLVISCLSSEMPIRALDWGKYLKILEMKSGGVFLTALKLGEYIADTLYAGDKVHAPMSILSFNAEPLLASIINAYCYVKYHSKCKVIDYLSEPTTPQYSKRIQLYFCHGVVPIPGSSLPAQIRFDASDKLVFSENEYLQLANASFSWQASSFINTLMNSTVFFVGLSLSDPNIRRWLAWIHQNKIEAIERLNSKRRMLIGSENNTSEDREIASTSHYWIQKIPTNENTKKMYEASVAHLGIRVIWVSSYDHIIEVLKKAIGFSPKQDSTSYILTKDATPVTKKKRVRIKEKKKKDIAMSMRQRKNN